MSKESVIGTNMALDETIIQVYEVYQKDKVSDWMSQNNLIGFDIKTGIMLIYPMINFYNMAYKEKPRVYNH